MICDNSKFKFHSNFYLSSNRILKNWNCTYRIVAVSVGHALVATGAGDARRADARAGVGVAQRRRRTIARFAVRETEVARLAAGALATDDARFARTLTTKLVAFEAHGTLGVALTRQCAAVELGRQGEHGLRDEQVIFIFIGT